MISGAFPLEGLVPLASVFFFKYQCFLDLKQGCSAQMESFHGRNYWVWALNNDILGESFFDCREIPGLKHLDRYEDLKL